MKLIKGFIKFILFCVLLVAVLVNAVIFVQAWKMTHFTASGARTPDAEQLTWKDMAWALVTGTHIPKPLNTSTPAMYRIPFKTVRCQGFNGASLESWVMPRQGAGTVIVMFHGYARAKDAQLPKAAVLYNLGYHIILTDFHGSGGSSGNTTSIGWYEAQDVRVVTEMARKQFPRCKIVLFGTSMGAAAVLKAVKDFPLDPDAIILECPYDSLLTAVRNRFRILHLPSTPWAELLVFWGGVQQGFDGFQFRPVDDAAGVRCPALYLQGGRDPRATPEQARAVYRNLKGPKHFVLFEQAAHDGMLGADRRLWTGSIRNFLASLGKKK